MKLGMIGCGKMGGALLGGVLARGTCQASDVVASDAIEAATTAMAAAHPGVVIGDNTEVAEHAEALLLCVKPHQVEDTLKGIAGRGNPLIVSIAAGISLQKLEAAAGNGARVARVMPNTPALIGKGAAAYAMGTACTDEDASTVHDLMSAVGHAEKVAEPLLEAVTGLSGSGPAYVYTVIEALADGGVLMGLSKPLALKLAAQTVAGAAEMVLQTGQHPAELRDAVTSPGGTTIAGIAKLEEEGLRAALIAAVRASAERARELG
jgi:pyrroline-5-carboxylate reductase